MCYLPIPSTCENAQLPRLPFRTTLTLDTTCLFAEFPRQHGFISDETLDLGRPEHEVEDLIQSWLYFGLLNEWCVKELDLSHFKVLDDNGDAVVNLDRVRKLLKRRVPLLSRVC
jgi:hypothetical protein